MREELKCIHTIHLMKRIWCNSACIFDPVLTIFIYLAVWNYYFEEQFIFLSTNFGDSWDGLYWFQHQCSQKCGHKGGGEHKTQVCPVICFIAFNEHCLENVYLRKADCTLFRQTSVSAWKEEKRKGSYI